MKLHTLSDTQLLQHAVASYGEECFFEAHEFFEILWLRRQGKEKAAFQGLIQLCGAFHHQQRGNLTGRDSLLEKAARRLETSHHVRVGIDLPNLTAEIEKIRRAYTKKGGKPLAAPSLHMLNE